MPRNEYNAQVKRALELFDKAHIVLTDEEKADLCSRVDALLAEEVARNVAIVTTEAVRVENLRIEDLVAMGRAPYTNWTGRMQDSDRTIVREAIEAVGMSDFIGRDSSSLSDGERQRIMVARAIAQ